MPDSWPQDDGDPAAPEAAPRRITRRGLLIGAGAAGALAIAWQSWPRRETPSINRSSDESVLGHFLKIGRDGHVTVIVPQTELGQGIYTAFAQIMADELGADWRTVAVEPSPVANAYANQLFMAMDVAQATPLSGVPDALGEAVRWRSLPLDGSIPAMITGGGTSIRMFEGPARQAAAAARAMLCMAAADRWDVTWEECETARGFVTHGERRLRFAELAAAAAEFTPPVYPPLRQRDGDDGTEDRGADDGRDSGAPPAALIGANMPRLDLPAKIDGSFGFAGDIRLPGLVYAAIRQGPVGDTSLVSFDERAGQSTRGFISAVRHKRWLAAVATNSWAARRALDAMAPVFTTPKPRIDSPRMERALLRAQDGSRIFAAGSTEEAFVGRTVHAARYYIAPALHASLETRSATAVVAPDGAVRVWYASQAPGAARAAVARALGVSLSAVTLIPVAAGGATGAAMEDDVAVQAALIARAVRRPVCLVWSRTEEILQDNPRAPALIRMRGTLSSGATIDGWQAQIATPAARHELWARLNGNSADAARRGSVGRSDAAMALPAIPPYRIPHVGIDHLPVDSGLPAGYMRGGADVAAAFATECFVDEMARRARVDPLSFRIGMLSGQARLVHCLQHAATLGGWDGGVDGSGQGLAAMALRGSHIAVMAIARRSDAGIQVQRLIAVADVGRLINPQLVRAQIEGGLLFGLAQAVGGTSRYLRGLAQARRIGELNLPRLAHAPAISVTLINSRRDPGGASDIAVPLVAPAIANALFTVTGRRLRRLPLVDRPIPDAE